jgi:amino acid transporter
LELFSNLVWILLSIVVLAKAYFGVRRGTVKVSMATAITLAVVMCFILMPLISVSDDLLEARQAVLPFSGQTWRMASEGASAGLDELLMIGLYLLMLMCFRTEAPASQRDQCEIHPLTGRLVRSQRLRPPPCAVL